MSLTNEFYSEEKRLKSFMEKSWPLASLKPQQLAKCGFFYLGDGDRVQCPFCGIVIFNWQSGDQPIFEHKIHSGKCPFINGRDVGNIFIDEDPREIYSLAESKDVCGFTHISPPEEKVEKIKFKSLVDPVNDPVNVTFVPFKAPQSIEFITYNSRLATFKDWPISEIITPSKLAESGFFYKGPVIDSHNHHYTDFVSCFHCGIALCQWVEGDDPWTEHKKFNPNCFYLKLVGTTAASSPSPSPELDPEPEPSPKLEPSAEPEPEPEPSAEPGPELEPEPSPKLEPEPEPSAEPEPEPKEKLSSESEPEPEPENQKTSSSQPKPFIPFTWLPKANTEELCCKICLDLQVGATFYPCLHASCAVCLSSISICPICRTKIESVVKLDTELVEKKISFYV